MQEAMAMLNKSGLDTYSVIDLYEQYDEDRVEFSEATALEKLTTAIKDEVGDG